MASANVPTYNKAFVMANKDIRDFQHLGHGVWIDGLSAPGTYQKRAVVGPGVEHWRAQSAAALALAQLSQTPVVHPPAMPTRSLAASVKRSLIVRLHLLGRGQEIQRMFQEQRAPVEADQDSSPAGIISTSSASSASSARPPVDRRRRMGDMIREFTEREDALASGMLQGEALGQASGGRTGGSRDQQGEGGDDSTGEL